MAFYSTRYTAKVVGPGISRCEYGGLMLTSTSPGYSGVSEQEVL